MIDTHCHILPGFDDGARDWDEALGMCRIACNDGIDAIIATPHTLDGAYTAERSTVIAKVEELNAAIRTEGLALRIYPGAEVRVHECLLDGVDLDRTPTLADSGRFLLLELFHHGLVPELDRILIALWTQRLTPVLAHAERNAGVQAEPEKLAPMIEAGLVVQITGASLLGRFGSAAQECAERLVKHRLAHIVASDGHDAEDRRPELAEAVSRIADIADEATAELMSTTRPMCIIEGEPFPPPDPVPIERKRRSWFSSLFR